MAVVTIADAGLEIGAVILGCGGERELPEPSLPALPLPRWAKGQRHALCVG
jgi:hypothetical protein